MRKNQNAFTLLEIMIVVSIIAVLLSLAIYRLRGNLESSKMVGVQADIQSISTQLKVYESFNGFVPTTEQGLQALVARPSTDPQPGRWTQLLNSVPLDPYHLPYVYRSPGQKHPESYDLFSAGPDRKPDTGDDDWGNNN